MFSSFQKQSMVSFLKAASFIGCYAAPYRMDGNSNGGRVWSCERRHSVEPSITGKSTNNGYMLS